MFLSGQGLVKLEDEAQATRRCQIMDDTAIKNKIHTY